MQMVAHALRTGLNRFFGRQNAASATEYAVMLALIIVVSLGAIRMMGESLSGSVAWVVADSLINA